MHKYYLFFEIRDFSEEIDMKRVLEFIGITVDGTENYLEVNEGKKFTRWNYIRIGKDIKGYGNLNVSAEIKKIVNTLKPYQKKIERSERIWCLENIFRVVPIINLGVKKIPDIHLDISTVGFFANTNTYFDIDMYRI